MALGTFVTSQAIPRSLVPWFFQVGRMRRAVAPCSALFSSRRIIPELSKRQNACSHTYRNTHLQNQDAVQLLVTATEVTQHYKSPPKLRHRSLSGAAEAPSGMPEARFPTRLLAKRGVR